MQAAHTLINILHLLPTPMSRVFPTSMLSRESNQENVYLPNSLYHTIIFRASTEQTELNKMREDAFMIRITHRTKKCCLTNEMNEMNGVLGHNCAL